MIATNISDASFQSIRIMEGTLQWIKYETPPSARIFLFLVFVYYFPQFSCPGPGFLLWGWSDPASWQSLCRPAVRSSNQDIPPPQLPRSASTNGGWSVYQDQVWRFVELLLEKYWTSVFQDFFTVQQAWWFLTAISAPTGRGLWCATLAWRRAVSRWVGGAGGHCWVGD